MSSDNSLVSFIIGTEQYNPSGLGQGTQVADASGMVGAGSQKVTDPNILAQLNSTDNSQEVTDPAILAQLNGNQPDQELVALKAELASLEKIQSTQQQRDKGYFSGIGSDIIFAIVLFAIAISIERYVAKKRKNHTPAKFNIFEGARRLVKLIQIIAFVISLSIYNNIKDGVLNGAYLYLGIMLFSLIIGWIIRGFFNIPNFQNSKETIS